MKGCFITKHCSGPFTETAYCTLAAVGKTKYPPCLPKPAQTMWPSPRRPISIREIKLKRKTLSWRKKSGTQKQCFQPKVVAWGGGGQEKAATSRNTLWLCNFLNWGRHKEEGWWRTGIYFRKEIWILLEWPQWNESSQEKWNRGHKWQESQVKQQGTAANTIWIVEGGFEKDITTSPQGPQAPRTTKDVCNYLSNLLSRQHLTSLPTLSSGLLIWTVTGRGVQICLSSVLQLLPHLAHLHRTQTLHCTPPFRYGNSTVSLPRTLTLSSDGNFEYIYIWRIYSPYDTQRETFFVAWFNLPQYMKAIFFWWGGTRINISQHHKDSFITQTGKSMLSICTNMWSFNWS